ncbi:MAG: serine/threonine protein kinase [Gemmataceae bacterium]|nr:serine/threonine protein kinase [Gemmataceae bacterium]
MAKPTDAHRLDLPGTSYTLLQPLGRGAFGEVYRARAPGGVEVAVKLIHRTLAAGEAQRELEALQLIKGLRHQNLLSLQAFFALADRLVIVMELADGSLRQRLRQCQEQGQAGIPTLELLGYFREAADALDYLHENRIQHRDLKPDNILLLGRHAKVGDYGLARLLDRPTVNTVTTQGTPAYMAPEVWEGQITTHSDQYSLALAYAELRLGHSLCAGANVAQMMYCHLHGSFDLSSFGPAETRVLRRALSRSPIQRYPTCMALVRDLSAAVWEDAERGAVTLPSTGQPGAGGALQPTATSQQTERAPVESARPSRKQAPPPPDVLPVLARGARPPRQASRPQPRKRRPLLVSMLCVVLAIAAGLAAWYFLPWHRIAPPTKKPPPVKADEEKPPPVVEIPPPKVEPADQIEPRPVSLLVLVDGSAQVEGELTNLDALDKNRKESHCKVYTVDLLDGRTYQIDHISKAFDAYLRLEDPDGKHLLENDDGGGDLNSRITHHCERSGRYRMVVTTFRVAETGRFTLQVREVMGR